VKIKVGLTTAQLPFGPRCSKKMNAKIPEPYSQARPRRFSCRRKSERGARAFRHMLAHWLVLSRCFGPPDRQQSGGTGNVRARFAGTDKEAHEPRPCTRFWKWPGQYPLIQKRLRFDPRGSLTWLVRPKQVRTSSVSQMNFNEKRAPPKADRPTSIEPL
jgi:hypothetical protein